MALAVFVIAIAPFVKFFDWLPTIPRFGLTIGTKVITLSFSTHSILFHHTFSRIVPLPSISNFPYAVFQPSPYLLDIQPQRVHSSQPRKLDPSIELTLPTQ
jgi:hypothetical protein